MIDHITLRVADLATTSRAFTALLDELEIEQTMRVPSEPHEGAQNVNDHPTQSRRATGAGDWRDLGYRSRGRASAGPGRGGGRGSRPRRRPRRADGQGDQRRGWTGEL